MQYRYANTRAQTLSWSMTKRVRSAVVKQVTAMWRSHLLTPAIVRGPPGWKRPSVLLKTIVVVDNADAAKEREDDCLDQYHSLSRMCATSWHLHRVHTSNRPRHEPRPPTSPLPNPNSPNEYRLSRIVSSRWLHGGCIDNRRHERRQSTKSHGGCTGHVRKVQASGSTEARGPCCAYVEPQSMPRSHDYLGL